MHKQTIHVKSQSIVRHETRGNKSGRGQSIDPYQSANVVVMENGAPRVISTDIVDSNVNSDLERITNDVMSPQDKGVEMDIAEGVKNPDVIQIISETLSDDKRSTRD